MATPVYFASLLGLHWLLEHLLADDREENHRTKSLVNEKRGYLGTALQAASYNGYESAVQLLLNRDIDINISGGAFGSALLAVSYNGQTGVSRMLSS
jgi:hypothetical protein